MAETFSESEMLSPLDSNDSAKPETNYGVQNLGYRGWSGRSSLGWMRWLVISSIGVRRAWQSAWVRRMLFFAWLPGLWFGAGFFLWEQAAVRPHLRDALTPFLIGLSRSPEYDVVLQSLETGDMASGRHTMWSWLLQTFFRYPQGLLMVMVVGLIAPPMISQDIRSRAFLIYFSRPVTRGEYLLGKLATLWAYTALISTVPALSLYLVGVLLSSTVNVVHSTWDIPLRIVAASITLMLPTSALALCMSSLTRESRYAGFAWFAVWIMGWFTYGAATSAEALNAQQHNSGPGDAWSAPESAWTHLSLYHTLGRVQRWVFGFSGLREVWLSLLILSTITLVSLMILFHRISAPMRV